jgi:beta-mannosidase
MARYSYDCNWMERKSWWFKNEFYVDAAALKNPKLRACRLTLESLDLLAEIYVNGVLVGKHESAHFPFTADVRRWLKAGKNVLLVRLTEGIESVSKGDFDYLSDNICTEYEQRDSDRGEKRRAMLRKPQYVYGWDWGPRCGTVGIMKGASIEFLNDLNILAVHPVTL